jgi:hypothetical protein
VAARVAGAQQQNGREECPDGGCRDGRDGRPVDTSWNAEAESATAATAAHHKQGRLGSTLLHTAAQLVVVDLTNVTHEK